MKQTNRIKFIVLFIVTQITFIPFLESQNCFDADFESGTIGGYETFYGEIDNDGVVTFPNKGVDATQHKIMRLQDGFDPIAEQYCILNKELLVAGNNTGRYTLRLGDAVNGARTSKVVLSFEVTQDVSFFLLKYAVVLNDPDHDYHLQPSFELYIKDENGETLDCGEYKVRAAANNPGFEKCGEWRVRPWTTAGFELKSYVGQTINIEILSTDCGLSGHGGYAYIDATCTPLQLDLDSYCPGAGYARYIVTDGFESYLWNTGQTERIIDIDNPVPGTEYSVTVTSATGCTLVLKDTLPMLPELSELMPSFFDEPDTLTVCFGEEVLYKPTGTNLDQVKALELGYSNDEFYLFAEESRIIHFVTSDNLGCASDTSHLVLNVINLEPLIDIIATCDGMDLGEIIIDNLGDTTLLSALGNMPYSNVNHFKGLSAGEYVIHLTNGSGCTFDKNVIIVPFEAPEIYNTTIIPATCGEDNGWISMISKSDSILYSINGSTFMLQSTWSNLKGGNYTIHYRNTLGCTLEKNIVVESYFPPKLDIVSTDNAYCGESDGFIITNTIDGYPPLRYSINKSNYIEESGFYNLEGGNYSIVVNDNAGCKDTISATIIDVPYTDIKGVNTTVAFCDENNGTLTIIPFDSTIILDYYVDNILYKDTFIENLESGTHDVIITDMNGCTDSSSAFIVRRKPPKIDAIQFLETPCEIENSSILIHAESYNDSIFYAYNTIGFTRGNLFHLEPGENHLFVKDDLDCETDTIVYITDFDNYPFANIFSPNGDNINDNFCFQFKENVSQILEFRIFDRWGNLMYDEATSRNSFEFLCWDGLYNNAKVESGVFAYTFKARLLDGRLLCKVGDITVIY